MTPQPPQERWRTNYEAVAYQQLIQQGMSRRKARKEARLRADRWFQGMQNPRRLPVRQAAAKG